MAAAVATAVAAAAVRDGACRAGWGCDRAVSRRCLGWVGETSRRRETWHDLWRAGVDRSVGGCAGYGGASGGRTMARRCGRRARQGARARRGARERAGLLGDTRSRPSCARRRRAALACAARGAVCAGARMGEVYGRGGTAGARGGAARAGGAGGAVRRASAVDRGTASSNPRRSRARTEPRGDDTCSAARAGPSSPAQDTQQTPCLLAQTRALPCFIAAPAATARPASDAAPHCTAARPIQQPRGRPPVKVSPRIGVATCYITVSYTVCRERSRPVQASSRMAGMQQLTVSRQADAVSQRIAIPAVVKAVDCRAERAFESAQSSAVDLTASAP